MARRGLIAILTALVLTGCQMTLPFGGDRAASPPAILPGGEIEVTPLDAAPTAVAAETEAEVPAEAEVPTPPSAATEGQSGLAATDEPAAEDPAAEAAPAPPPVAKSEAQLRCERQGGEWASARGATLRTCVKPTGQGAKQCRTKTDCKGECLARSRTCAPFTPLLGCNDVLLADGSRTTLCLD